jgi:hypothetical protein
MKKLPDDRMLPVEKLAACFNNTVATYKFYWLLSLLHFIEKEKTLVTKREMFACMISRAWYTINYFHISFGAQDRIQQAVQQIRNYENLSIEKHQNEILDQLIKSNNTNTIKTLVSFDTNVPHWFLSPWFPKETKDSIYSNSHSLKYLTPYALEKEFISINPIWANYLKKNAALIRDFCYWNLALFLQKRNPSVPDIPNKLIKPADRPSLRNQRIGFWDVVFDKHKEISCIYTGIKLIRDSYAVEHFVPYNFVSHNLIWNLIPANSTFNSIKSDKLPPPEVYFNPFFELQLKAIKCVAENAPKNKYLEEYLIMMPGILDADKESIRIRFKETIIPLISIAHNNGFEYLQKTKNG